MKWSGYHSELNGPTTATGGIRRSTRWFAPRTATGRSPFICPPAASFTISTWTARSGSTRTTTGGSATPAGPSIPFDTSPPGVISMAQRKVRGRIVSLTRRGHLATRGRRLPLVPGEFERVVSPNGTRTLGVVRRMAGMLAFVGIASRESRAVANPSAWAIDRHALAVASERGCDVVAILDADSNDTWTGALSQVKQVGVRSDRGCERQWAVPFECWTRLRDHTPFRQAPSPCRNSRDLPGAAQAGNPWSAGARRKG